MTMIIAKRKFQSAKFGAKKRGIPFLLTFEQWYNWWLSQGIDKNQPVIGGLKRSQLNELCMCRFGDQGPYTLNNIYCSTRSQNSKDAHTHPSYVKKILNARQKPIQTPLGRFDSLTQAGKAYGLDKTTIGHRLKKYPKQYYYL